MDVVRLRSAAHEPDALHDAPPSEAGGGRSSTPTRRSGDGRVARWLDQNRWAPVVVKVSIIVAGTLGLAAIGAASTVMGPGREVPVDERSTTAQAGMWLAPDPMAANSETTSSPPTRVGDVGNAPTLIPPKPSSGPAKSHGLAHPHEDEAKAAPQRGITKEGKVILNTATAAELTRLPGVGAKRAATIVALRERIKRFRRPADLLRVRGIGVRTLKKMLPHLVLDPPAPSRDEAASDDQPKH